MKKLKTFAGVFAVLALVGGLAIGAPYNIQQKDSGTNWTTTDGTAVPVGGPITFEFTSLQDAWTRYVVAHKNGRLTKAWAILDIGIADSASASTLSFSYATDGGGRFFTISGLALNPTRFTAGKSVSDTPDGTDLSVSQGDTIAIRNDGGSAEVDSPGSVMIFIE